MGFHSLDCRSCGHPALASYVTNDVNAWMNQVVVTYPNGDRVTGSYDGYGSVSEHEDVVGHGDVDLRHRACWRAAGEPGYGGPSQHSRDQGYFFEEGVHDVPEPHVTVAAAVEAAARPEPADVVTVPVAELRDLQRFIVDMYDTEDWEGVLEAASRVGKLADQLAQEG
jgi:hypothetical protein